MNRNLKISLGLVAIAVIALMAVVATSTGDPVPGSGDSAVDRLVRPDSQRLSVAADDKVTFVEFLDFECEACGAAYPAVEQLREMYEGRVTFVVRNFPLHYNSEAAASAAIAAAAQGEFEGMYHRLFQTQAEWAEQQTSKQEVFFGFAEDLGLDMEQFRATYEDPATLQLIRRDQADGQALGVQGTPTFFLNGIKVEVSTFAELIALIDAALDA